MPASRTFFSSACARSSTSALGCFSTSTGAIMTFCSAVLCGNRLYCWNTIDTSLRSAIISVIGREPMHRVRADVDLAAVDRNQAVDAAQQRRLARARRPDDAHRLAFALTVERDAAQHLDRAEGLVHVDEPHDRRVGAARSERTSGSSVSALAGTSITRGDVAGRGEKAFEIGVGRPPWSPC